jgi:hypothetical protein
MRGRQVGLGLATERVDDEASSSPLHGPCEGLAGAVNGGDVGETVERVQKLILKYYEDVQRQATQSFESARRVAYFGFALIVGTIVYVIFTDLVLHIDPRWFRGTRATMNVGAIGLISGGIVEFIAAVNFTLYGRAARQFGAFHICLERTHRYLLAYKIAEGIETEKDKTLEKIVCIMANAPMITRQDIDGVESGGVAKPSGATAVRPEVVT